MYVYSRNLLTSLDVCKTVIAFSTSLSRSFSFVDKSFKLEAPIFIDLSETSYFSDPTVSVTLKRDSTSESFLCVSKLVRNFSISPLTKTLWSNIRYWALKMSAENIQKIMDLFYLSQVLNTFSKLCYHFPSLDVL